MDFLDRQTRYWDGAAGVKRFTHPLERGFFAGRVPKDARILDLGCGYGRIVSDLSAEGYGNVVGIDISGGMIERGRRTCAFSTDPGSPSKRAHSTRSSFSRS